MQAQCCDVVDLVEAARRGDQRAWWELHQRFHRLVWDKVLSQVRRYDQAADVVQEIFLLAFRKLDQLREPVRFVGWLLIIAHNRTASWLRRTQNQSVVASLPKNLKLRELIDPSPGPAQLLEQKEQLRILQEGLGSLSAIHRHALEAFYLDRRSLRQISRQSCKPVGTIKRRLHDARHRLAIFISR